MRSRIAGSLAALALCGPAFAGPIAVDGSLADWGVTVGDNNTSNFSSPNVAGLSPTGKVYFAVEDNPDQWGDSGFVGPNYGGQNYDVEFMGVAVDNNRMYIAIVTGQRPDNGFARFSPGDLRIVANNGHVYGIEVGGGAGGAATAGLLEEGAPGSTYTLNASGWTVSHTETGRTVGSIWEDPTWLLDPIAPGTEVQIGGGGNQVGTADFVYTRNDDPTQEHAVIELAFDLGIFAGATTLDIYWAPSCGNDVLVVHDDLPPGRVPEPGSLASLAAGLLAWRWARRRR